MRLFKIINKKTRRTKAVMFAKNAGTARDAWMDLGASGDVKVLEVRPPTGLDVCLVMVDSGKDSDV